MQGYKDFSAFEQVISVVKIMNLINEDMGKKNPALKDRVQKRSATTYSTTKTAVPSAQVGLTTLFGMGKGDHHRYSHRKTFCKNVIHHVSTNTIDILLKENTMVIQKFNTVEKSLRVISNTRL